MTATIPAQRRQRATCINGHEVANLLAACVPCLSDELDMDCADDLRSEARDED